MTDEELVIKARSGDYEAESELLYRYKDRVKTYSRGYFLTGGDYEDLIQEGMIGLCKAIREYSPGKEAAFKTFASICINRQIADAVKAANRKKHAPLNGYSPLDVSADEQASGRRDNRGIDPELYVLAAEENTILNDKLKAILTERELAVLRGFMQGLSYGEIGDATGINVKAVDNSLQSIRKKIKKNV
ncbi:MAG: sigma-70 family RNA polymerase sigma factor [Clostridiaceae bacterium]|jgi:RNA polymerase sporulation-specific sigma factor|nr:sigma-70 family RNA polymerase sigma factor [Clostridiaceae bacterium]